MRTDFKQNLIYTNGESLSEIILFVSRFVQVFSILIVYYSKFAELQVRGQITYDFVFKPPCRSLRKVFPSLSFASAELRTQFPCHKYGRLTLGSLMVLAMLSRSRVRTRREWAFFSLLFFFFFLKVVMLLIVSKANAYTFLHPSQLWVEISSKIK